MAFGKAGDWYGFVSVCMIGSKYRAVLSFGRLRAGVQRGEACISRRPGAGN